MNILSSVASSVSLTCVWILPFLLLFVAAYASRTRRLGVNHHEYLLLWEREVFYTPLSLFFPSLITVLPVKRYITAFSLSPFPSPPSAQLGQWGTSCQPPHHHHHLQFLLELVSMLPLLDVTLVVVCKWSNVSLSLSLSLTHTHKTMKISSPTVFRSPAAVRFYTERCRRRRITVVGPH